MQRLKYLHAIYMKKDMGIWCSGETVMFTQHLHHELFCLLIWAGSCPWLLELMSMGVKGWTQCPYTRNCKYRNNWAVLWNKFNFMKAKKRSHFLKPQQLWMLATHCEVNLAYSFGKLSVKPSFPHELHFQHSAHREQDLQAKRPENL